MKTRPGCSPDLPIQPRLREPLRELGAGTVVVKLGGRGCAVFGAEGMLESPAFSVPVVDTTGAGDCFAGAFLAARLRARSYAEAAQFANAVGALSIQR